MRVLKQKRGITLIALIISVIVMLILATVSINMLLGENGILTKSQETVGKYQNAVANEKTEIADLEYQIDMNSRDTVTIPKEEYYMFKSQFSKNGNVSINKPNTWQVGTEYDFGDGVYGQRFEKRGTQQIETLGSIAGMEKSISCGGTILKTDGNIATIPTAYEGSMWYTSASFPANSSNGRDVNIVNGSGKLLYEGYIDFWVLYTKTTN